MKKLPKIKAYTISRLIIPIITFIVFKIMFIHEDESWLFLPVIFAGIAYVISIPSSYMCNFYIKNGNKLNSKSTKILYYALILPLIIFVVSVGLSAILTSAVVVADLGEALVFLGFLAIIVMCFIIPYAQALLVLLISKYITKEPIYELISKTNEITLTDETEQNNNQTNKKINETKIEKSKDEESNI